MAQWHLDATWTLLPCSLADHQDFLQYMSLAQNTAGPWSKLSVFWELGLNSWGALGQEKIARYSANHHQVTSTAWPGSLTEDPCAGGPFDAEATRVDHWHEFLKFSYLRISATRAVQVPVTWFHYFCMVLLNYLDGVSLETQANAALLPLLGCQYTTINWH